MRTLFFENRPKIIATSSVGGPKESQGQIGEYIEIKLQEDTFGEKTFERAESKMLFTAIKSAMENSGRKEKDIDLILSGDLLNQITASTFAARRFDIGYVFQFYNLVQNLTALENVELAAQICSEPLDAAKVLEQVDGHLDEHAAHHYGGQRV